MSLFTSKRPPDRAQVHAMLKALTQDLVRVLGDELVSLILHGDIVKRQNQRSIVGPVNVMLVLRQISCQQLDLISPVIAKAEKTIPLGLMTLTLEDIQTSCDVFPIKFHDMQHFHRLLAGRDVLSELEVSDANLRLRCEQQLKNLTIRLRATYLRRNKSDTELVNTLCEATNNFLRDISACVFLKTGIVPENEHDLVSDFGEQFEIEMGVMQDVLRIWNAENVTATQEIRNIFDRFMKLVHDSATAADEIEASA